MPQERDSAVKYLMHLNTLPFVKFILGELAGGKMEIVEIVDTQQPKFVSHEGNSTVKVKIDGKPMIVHIEFQVTDSAQPMWARLATYSGYLIGIHQYPVYCTVVYLRPTAGRKDPGGYAYDVGHFKYLLQYKVLRLSEVDGESVLQQQVPELLPFTGLMKRPAGMG